MNTSEHLNEILFNAKYFKIKFYPYLYVFWLVLRTTDMLGFVWLCPHHYLILNSGLTPPMMAKLACFLSFAVFKK